MPAARAACPLRNRAPEQEGTGAAGAEAPHHVGGDDRRNEPEARLGGSEAGGFLGDDVIGTHRESEAASERRSLHRRNDRRRERGNRSEKSRKAPRIAAVFFLARPSRLPHRFQVGPGAEDPPLPLQHHHPALLRRQSG